MNEIEKRLSRAIEDAPSVSVEKLKAADVKKMEAHDEITMQEQRKSHTSVWMRYAAAAACIGMCFLLIFGLRFQRREEAVVDFDVNPGIEIALNRSGKVVRMEAVNQEGEDILKKIDYKNRKADQVIGQMLDEMIKQGYLSKEKLKNQILLSVQNGDRGETAKLKNRLNTVVSRYLAEKGMKVQVIAQEMPKDEKESKTAEKYGISLGKLTLIRKVMKKHKNLKLENLAKYSLGDLIQLLEGSTETKKKKEEPASSAATAAQKQETTRSTRSTAALPKRNTRSAGTTRAQSSTSSRSTRSTAGKTTRRPSGRDEEDEEDEDEEDENEEEEEDWQDEIE